MRLRNLLLFSPYSTDKNFLLEEDENNKGNDDPQLNEGGKKLFDSYINDITYMKRHLYLEKNGDVKTREFKVKTKDWEKDAIIFFIDGLVNKTQISEFILKPLMHVFTDNSIKSVSDLVENFLPQNVITMKDTFDELYYDLNYGNVILFINGMKKAAVIDVKGWEHKQVANAQTEMVIRGPNDAFTELIRTNTALVRRLVRNKNLIVEETNIGRVSQTTCALLYIKNIANDQLVKEAKRRIESIDVDYVLSSAELEQFIEEKSVATIPQFLSTERPDRATRALIDGKIVIMVDGSPYALIAPVTVFDINSSPEDPYLRWPYVNFINIVRAIAFFLSLLLSGMYVAIINFHNEMLPTDILMSIVAAREEVPFPTFIEILLMEISLEIIREAGIRIPAPVGPTLSIVGALILGQAAVSAKLVSPILIIVVSLEAIGSFATPNYYLSFSVRLLRFVYIILGGVAGFLGITAGLFVHGLIWVNTKSMGVPMVAPYAPRTKRGIPEGIYTPPIWKREYRDDYLNVKLKRKQRHISRGWKKDEQSK